MKRTRLIRELKNAKDREKHTKMNREEGIKMLKDATGFALIATVPKDEGVEVRVVTAISSPQEFFAIGEGIDRCKKEMLHAALDILRLHLDKEV